MSAVVDVFKRDLEAYQTLRKRWRADPELYTVQRLGMRPTWQQKAIINAIQSEGAKVTVRSGHNTGKSAASAGILLWFLETRDYSKIPCTAPSSHQLKDVLWAEVSKWIRKADSLSAKRGDHPRLWLSNLFKVTNDRIYDPSAKEWFAVARTSGRDNPDALQGFHASELQVSEDGKSILDDHSTGSLLFIIDEASGVLDQVYEVAEGALASPGSRLLMLGNPTKLTGYFADSHRHNRGEFETIRLKTSDSPLADPNYRQKLVRKWGEGSNVVRVRADGEFPKQDDDVLISLEDAEAAIDREPYGDTTEIRLGVDVARFGSDRTVFTVRRGRDILYVEAQAKKDTMETAGKTKQLSDRFHCKPYVDVIGVGAGVADRLTELGVEVVEVNVAKEAPKRVRDEDEAQGFRLRDHLWLEMARWFRDEQPSLSGIDRDMAEDIAGEVSTVKYKLDSSGRIVVESKDEMKKRLGFSPDLADSLACTFCDDTIENWSRKHFSTDGIDSHFRIEEF